MLQQMVDITSAIVWPAVLVFIAVFFRSSLRGLMERENFSVKAPGGFELSANRRAEGAAEIVTATQSVGAPPISPAAALETVDEGARTVHRLGEGTRMLWVDDRPSNNHHERNAFAAIGIDIDLSTSTDDALQQIGTGTTYQAVISDMARPESPEAGFDLLNELRARGDRTPYIIYAGKATPELFDEAVRRTAEGCTNRPQELISMVMTVLRRNLTPVSSTKWTSARRTARVR